MVEYNPEEVKGYMCNYAHLLLMTSSSGSMINGFFDTYLPLLIAHGKHETATLKSTLDNAKKIPKEIMPERGQKALSVLEEAVQLAEKLDAEHRTKLEAEKNRKSA